MTFEAYLPPFSLESVPSFTFKPIPVSPTFSGGNFEELFHSEFSEFIEASPIIDTIAPNCPTNLKARANTNKKQILFTWCYPINNSSDDSTQDDIKEFELLMYDRETTEFTLVAKTVVPMYLYNVPESLLSSAFNDGLSFSVRAIDYHDLVSKTSKILNVKLNKDYGCKNKEILPEYLSLECGSIEDRNKILVHNMIIKSDYITFAPATFVSIKEPFKNKSNVLLITIRDLNTGKKFELELTIVHNKIIKFKPIYTPVSIISPSASPTIESGGIRGRF